MRGLRDPLLAAFLLAAFGGLALVLISIGQLVR